METTLFILFCSQELSESLVCSTLHYFKSVGLIDDMTLIAAYNQIVIDEAARARAREKINYDPTCVNIAVTGLSGSGKSSLINAFRGIGGRSPTSADRAATGTTETTSQCERFVDQRAPWIVWYDIPGCGTDDVPVDTYFMDHCLFAFDHIIILMDSRIFATDRVVLTTAKQLRIPATVVRSKSDSHIRAVMYDEFGFDADNREHGDQEQFKEKWTLAKKSYVHRQKKLFTEYCREHQLDDYYKPASLFFLVSSRRIVELMKAIPIPKNGWAAVTSQPAPTMDDSNHAGPSRLAVVPEWHQSSSVDQTSQASKTETPADIRAWDHKNSDQQYESYTQWARSYLPQMLGGLPSPEDPSSAYVDDHKLINHVFGTICKSRYPTLYQKVKNRIKGTKGGESKGKQTA